MAMAASSTLSSLDSRTPTPFSRYNAADESGSIPADHDILTDISSPGDAADVEAPYRDAKVLPEELRSRCQIQLEEQTYEPALTLLNSLLCDGISHTNASTKPGSVPPPAQLSLLATLAIHPRQTSKLTSLAAHEVGSVSLSVLRNVLATVGPVNGRLRHAFEFHGDVRTRRRISNGSSDNGFESEEQIRGKMAGAHSVWTCGQDFWSVLGWAFNCSALHPHRWRWWKPWLEYMVDVLENDYEERKRLDEECDGNSEHCEYKMLRDSLLVSYITPKSSRSSQLKPIMSALFADGGSSSTMIFKEVFQDEAKVASKTVKKRKRVDLDKDDFGDYADDSSSGGSQPPTPERKHTTERSADDDVPWTSSSLTDTIPLRLRLFALVRNLAQTFEKERTALTNFQLSRAIDDVPDRCHIKISDLYGRFVDKIALLPVPAFAQFIASLHNQLDQGPTVAIIQVLMPHLAPPSAPSPQRIDKEAADLERVSPKILERCYLPFAYKTAENNAKLSLVNETLFRILWTSGCLKWTSSLQEAVEKGVKARRDKSAPKSNRNDGDNATRETLRASGGRIMILAELLKLREQGDDVTKDVVMKDV